MKHLQDRSYQGVVEQDKCDIYHFQCLNNASLYSSLIHQFLVVSKNFELFQWLRYLFWLPPKSIITIKAIKKILITTISFYVF